LKSTVVKTAPLKDKVTVAQEETMTSKCVARICLHQLSFWFRYSTSKNVMTLKSGSNVTQGHWKCRYHSIDCLVSY